MDSSRRKRWQALAAIACFGIASASCASVFEDQVRIPGTNKRIAVGNDGEPNRKAWVYEDGAWHPIKIVRADR